MFEKKNTNTAEQYLEDWPLHYYEITDINEREKILRKRLEVCPEDADDLERLAVFEKRFGKAARSNRPDHFIHALLMLRQIYDTQMNAMNRSRLTGEYLEAVRELDLKEHISEIQKEEYRDMIRRYINVSSKSFSRPAFLGMGKRSDDKVSDVMKDNLEIIFLKVPQMFKDEVKFEVMREIAEEAVNSY